MTTSPKGFDFNLTVAALFDYAALFQYHSRGLEVLFGLLLEDPTESSHVVRNLSSGEPEAVFAVRNGGLTVLYQFSNPLGLKVIHISDAIDNID